MYGRSYRTYPIARILADLDDIYYRKKTKMVFITDDNMVLNPAWVMNLCDAIIRRNYQNLKLIVQADCVTIAHHEAMVKKMSEAGFRVIFLGIENVSSHNLRTLEKSDIVEASRRAVEICHRYGIMVIGGLIFGLPADDEEAIKKNYQFFSDLGADASYFQILTPYPKTRIREYLIGEGLVTHPQLYERYNGLWANVKTRHLDADQLQYAFWYYRQTALGWWKPSVFAEKQGAVWTAFWTHMVKPVMKFFTDRQIQRIGWEGRYRQYLHRLGMMNRLKDLEKFREN
jgi:radical SAM superfamily enzyme YgiQ (UPF0313 family)